MPLSNVFSYLYYVLYHIQPLVSRLVATDDRIEKSQANQIAKARSYPGSSSNESRK
jgi:hypothetical protein